MIASVPDIDLHSLADNNSGGENGILMGHKGTGKSTVGTHLTRRFLRRYANSHVLIFDSKPRYRATWRHDGLGLDYKGWVKGDVLPGSVAISDHHVDLSTAWALSRVVIFQSMTANSWTQRLNPFGTSGRSRTFADWRRRCGEYCEQAFEFSREDRPVLLYFDEMYDEVSGMSGFADSRILKCIRAGRERNMSNLIAAQRPKSIPLFSLTEAENFYIFHLQSVKDRTYLTQYGPPIDYEGTAPIGHQFIFHREFLGGQSETFLTQLRLGEGK